MIAYKIQYGRIRMKNELNEKQQQLYNTTQMHASERFSPTVIQNCERTNDCYWSIPLSLQQWESERHMVCIDIIEFVRQRNGNRRTLLITLIHSHSHTHCDYALEFFFCSFVMICSLQVEFKHYINICFAFYRQHFSLFAVRSQFRTICAILVQILLSEFEFYIKSLRSQRKELNLNKMALVKEVVSLIILMVISKFLVSCGHIHPSDYERLSVKRSGTINDQRNIAAPTAWADPNYTPGSNPQSDQRIQFPGSDSLPTVQATLRTTTQQPLLSARNNFGDLPVKCGPNQEKIHGACRDV